MSGFAREQADGAEIVSLDVLDQASLIEAGRLIWQHRGATSARRRACKRVEQALVAHWQAAGLILDAAPVQCRSAALAAHGVRLRLVLAGHGRADRTARSSTAWRSCASTCATRAVDAAEWDRETGACRRSADFACAVDHLDAI